MSVLQAATFHICSYLSKYLILQMLNYHPLEREHQIFRGAEPV
jgi:hypothetical protein